MTDAPGSPRVAILADDLNWATRLASIVRLAGGDAVSCGSAAAFGAAVAGADGAIVDLSIRGADPFAAIVTAAGAGTAVIAVGPHEDTPARKRAIAAGARRVYAYRKLYEDGPATIATWLGLPDSSTPALPPR